eukprot:236396-Chlamydomonas_euryale.AAC.2
MPRAVPGGSRPRRPVLRGRQYGRWHTPAGRGAGRGRGDAGGAAGIAGGGCREAASRRRDARGRVPVRGVYGAGRRCGMRVCVKGGRIARVWGGRVWTRG